MQRTLFERQTRIKRALSKIDLASKNLTPGSDASLEYSKKSYIMVLSAYTEADQFLSELEMKKNLAEKLADDHSKFGDLPEQIEKLEKKVAFLKANVEIHAQFQQIEAAMKDMPDELKMKDISKVMESGKDLANVLKNLLLDNPGLKDNVEVKKFLDEIPLNKNWTGGDIYKCIALNFPGLKNQINRLMNANSEIQNKFIDQIEKKTNESIPYLEYHSKLSKEIKECKQTMEGKTFGAKFAKFFYEILSKDYLDKKLQHLQENQSVIYAKIKNLSKDLMNKEMDPLISFKKPELGQYIEAFRKITVAFQAEYEINNLINELKLENNDEMILKNGVNNIAQILEKNFEGVIAIKKENLPKNFAKLTPKDQFRVLIAYSFPKLRENNNELFKLIKEKKLEEKLSEILISRIHQEKPEIIQNQNIKEEEEIREVLPKDVQESVLALSPSNIENIPPLPNLLNIENLPPQPTNLENIFPKNILVAYSRK